MITTKKVTDGQPKVAPPPGLEKYARDEQAQMGIRIAVSPDLATEWLERRGNNRPVRDTTVHTYAHEMKEGRWKFNGQPIQFDEAGALLNGQHRLWAIVESGVTVDTVIQWGIDRDAQDTIDVGRKWMGADVLHMVGEQNTLILSAGLTWLWREKRGHLATNWQPSTVERMELLKQFPSIRDSVKRVATWTSRTFLAPSIACYCHWKFSQIDPERADDFISKLYTGSDLSEENPIYRLREKIIYHRTKRIKLLPSEELAFIIITWNAYIKGRKLKQLTWKERTPGVEKEFPMIEDADGKQQKWLK